MARNVMDQLIANGKVHRGQLGVMIEPVPPDKAASLGLKQPGGVLIASVPANTPAARAGLRKGDVVTAFQGQPVTGGNTLRNRVASTPPGTTVKLTILRDKREQEIEATLGEYEPPKQSG